MKNEFSITIKYKVNWFGEKKEGVVQGDISEKDKTLAIEIARQEAEKISGVNYPGSTGFDIVEQLVEKLNN